MRADNKGEGGILALLSLAFPERSSTKSNRQRSLLVLFGVFGAALLYGDGMITPAITVLGAMEGLDVAAPALKPFVVPVTVLILIGLFSCQRMGTGRVGIVFGPITSLWFVVIAALGVRGIVFAPEVMSALNPLHAIRFFTANGWMALVALGSVFLVLTGTEALYADMGHFGRGPIRLAWFWVVLPALVLNYLGQGALLLHDPAAVGNPFYNLAPRWALYPLVLLATLAAVIASQALIAGAFSVTMQAVQLGYCPRLEIDHTSSDERGQIYVPKVNWTLMLAAIALVLALRSSSNLAGAYGIAVSFTMLITSILFFFGSQRLWRWSPWTAAAAMLPFVVIEIVFLAANLLKIPHGGWFPLLVGLGVFTVMSTWKRGRAILAERLAASALPLDLFLQDIAQNPPIRVRGTAVFMYGKPDGTPFALLHNLQHNHVLHERIVILTILVHEEAHVDPASRVQVEKLKHGFYRVIGHYGFMEEPSVLGLLRSCAARDLRFEVQDTTFFLSRETIIPTPRRGMALWRERLFAYMARNAQPATAFFKLPVNRVVELGMQVEF
jgi:KUP system potassium uptake protein